MAIFVRSSSTASTGNPTVVTKPAGTTAGDLLVAAHFTDVFGNTAGMTGASGFTQAGTTYSGSGSCFGKVWQRAADGSEGSSFSFGNPDTTVVVMLAIGGHDTSTPINVLPTWSQGGPNQTSHIAPSVTPSVADGLLVCGFAATGASASYTPPGGMTEQGDAFAGFAFASLATEILVGGSGAATGTRTATCSIGGANDYTTLSLVIAPAAATAASLPLRRSRLGALVQM
ncbi:hypothetical protein [Nonomuraea guangzhouensis]|uniref:Uncharacterized protein n=1 Tax=Nonomuraea guangzhouensis TaxID=1291555 RepID=A0ABW4GXB5_9ACTN|nr:hypothetical protein [Nonomuraea guangzhouensis]